MRVPPEQEVQDIADKRSFQPVRERRGLGQQQAGAVLVPGPGDLRQGHEPIVRHDRRRSLEELLLQATELPLVQVPASRATERAQGARQPEGRAAQRLL